MSYQPMMPQANTSIYSLGSRRRYAQYPTFVRTPIPGAGFNRQLVMASQPIMLNGLGAGPNPMDVVNIAAGLLTSPEATLRARGPALVSAVDAHLMGPLVDSAMKAVKPYALKYVLPFAAVIMVSSIIGAVFSVRVARKVGA